MLVKGAGDKYTNMNDAQRLQLDKMIQANNVEDVTGDIRARKHSGPIMRDVETMVRLKKSYSRLAKSNPESFDSILTKQCSFLFDNYTDIFNKLKKDELDMSLLMHFLVVLKKIEDGELDQHKGAYEVGQVLKNMYIDSAVRKGDKLDDKMSGKKKVPKKRTKNVSWQQYKALQEARTASVEADDGGDKTDN